MSAWGYGSFENDTALDWLVDFEGEGADTVIVALEDVANADVEEEIDADRACVALAAAEIIAAAKTGDGGRLTDEARATLRPTGTRSTPPPSAPSPPGPWRVSARHRSSSNSRKNRRFRLLVQQHRRTHRQVAPPPVQVALTPVLCEADTGWERPVPRQSLPPVIS